MLLNPDTPLKVGILIAPGFVLMDIAGAHSVFGMAPHTELHVLWKDRAPIHAMPDFITCATTPFDECPPDLDVLVVGAVGVAAIEDPQLIDFLRKQCPRTRFVISICAGALLLGAAGFLQGRRATTNLHLIDALEAFGAEAVGGGEVVIDGPLYSAGPATGSFEAALKVLALLRGEPIAKLMELTIEYHPRPPFNVGTAELAGPELTAQTQALYADFFRQSTEAALEHYRNAHAAPC
ncbi:MAG: DJ-1/PfpI family protein [Pseudomonas sp.]|uniref:DJ-1/PfpI family protein n=1 Tax=Pseudomonas sp. TaxID=306 RepID=UPI003D0F7763